jgi:toluene monooxygenase system protein E
VKPVPPRATLKTYSHLAGGRRMPSEYELVTSGLVWHPRQGFEVNVPLAAWYREHQAGSPLACSDWERFADPRATTYASWAALQGRAEALVDGLLGSIEQRGSDAELGPEAWELLASWIPPLRFAVHGLQMVAAYVGQMAPAGRITVAAALQSADEVRRVQRLACRLALLRRVRPALGDDARAVWERAPAWQPLRETIERLLVAFDWGEAFTALNLCVKPALDALAMIELGASARRRGEPVLAEILYSLEADCRWHRAWSSALVALALGDRPENRDVLRGWVATWRPRALAAVASLAPLLGDDADGARERVTEVSGALLAELGLGEPE